jgi:hypothetical protein
MNIGKNWHYDGTPKTDTARMGLLLVERTLQLVDHFEPAFWVMENPRDKLRALPVTDGLERRTVTYCQYGEVRMKPTDLFSRAWPDTLYLYPPCKNGDPCHVRAPRGSTTGTQGFGSYHQKGVIPQELSTAFCMAYERELGETIA